VHRIFRDFRGYIVGCPFYVKAWIHNSFCLIDFDSLGIIQRSRRLDADLGPEPVLRVKFTPAFVRNVTPPKSGQIKYWDLELPGSDAVQWDMIIGGARGSLT
jgi:hypothetical protein